MHKTIDDYLDHIDEIIHASIKDSVYEKRFMSILLNALLSASLKDFDFSLDYTKIMLQENLVDSMQEDLAYIGYVKDVVKSEFPETYDDLYLYTIKSFRNLQKTSKQFIEKPIDFYNLLAIKKESLRDPNNDKVITFEKLLVVFNTTDTITFRDTLNKVCKIRYNVQDADILISWKQLSKVIFAYTAKPELQTILMQYYSEIDTIYELMISRVKEHNADLVCTPKDYYNYMGRVHKKNNSIIKIYKQTVFNLIGHANSLNTIINRMTGTTLSGTHTMPKVKILASRETVIAEDDNREFVHMPDMAKLERIDIIERVAAITKEFNILIGSVFVVPVPDTDEVDEDEIDI